MAWEVTVVNHTSDEDNNGIPSIDPQLSCRPRNATEEAGACVDVKFSPPVEITSYDAQPKLKIKDVWDKVYPSRFSSNNANQLVSKYGTVLSEAVYNIDEIESIVKLENITNKNKYECAFNLEGIAVASLYPEDSDAIRSWVKNGVRLPDVTARRRVSEAKAEYPGTNTASGQLDFQDPRKRMDDSSVFENISWPHVYVNNFSGVPDSVMSISIRSVGNTYYCYNNEDSGDYECHQTAYVRWDAYAFDERPAFKKGKLIYAERAKCFGLWSDTTQVTIAANWVIVDEFAQQLEDFDRSIEIVAVYKGVELIELVTPNDVWQSMYASPEQIASITIRADGTFEFD